MNTDVNRTRIEISRGALIDNVRQLSKLCAGSRPGIVVKSNAYGHGMEAVASVLDMIPEVDRLFVVGIGEGLTLRAAGISKKILALAYHDAPLKEAILNGIEITVHAVEPAFIKELDAAARACGKKAQVHVKIDTGLARLGVPEHDVMRCVGLLKAAAGIELVGIFTHLADTNNADPSYTYEQLDRFNNILCMLHEHAIHIPVSHALSSGGLALARPPLAPEARYAYTTTRIGTNVYGLWKSEMQKKRVHACDPSIELKPVLTWKARILSVVIVPAGHSIGYARTYVTPHDASIALLSIGYADGCPRSLSGKSRVMIGNNYAPVVGVISMNILAIDVTGIADAVPGAEVVLIGDAPGITADEVAAQAGIYTNELLARLNPLIPRCLIP